MRYVCTVFVHVCNYVHTYNVHVCVRMCVRTSTTVRVNGGGGTSRV